MALGDRLDLPPLEPLILSTDELDPLELREKLNEIIDRLNRVASIGVQAERGVINMAVRLEMLRRGELED